MEVNVLVFPRAEIQRPPQVSLSEVQAAAASTTDRMCVGASLVYLLRLREVKQSDICVTCNRHKTNGLKLL